MSSEVIGLQGIRYGYGGNAGSQVLAGCDLSVSAGESVAIVGQSGAGKSTVLGVLGGLLRPQGGQYRFRGRDMPLQDARGMAAYRREHTGYVFQNFCLLPQLSLLDNVLLPARVARLKGPQWRERGMQLLDRLGLAELHARRPNQISGGQAQRVAIARALLREPEILLADEPTGNLDSETAAAITAELLAHVSKGGVLVLVTHSWEAASRMQRVLELRDGQLVATDRRA